MKITHCLRLSLLAAGAWLTLPAQAAFTVNTVGVYDEQTTQLNKVDAFGTSTIMGGNQIHYDDFVPMVAAAFAAGFGGVINFDNPTSGQVQPSGYLAGDYLSAKYGASLDKTLQITNNSATAFSISSGSTDRTPISGTRFLGKSSDLPGGGGNSGAVGGNFIFGFSASDKVAAVGGTLLSRDGFTGNVTGQVTFSDSTTASALFNQTAGNGSGDLFFGFRITDAQLASNVYITQFSITPPANHYRGFDDLAFIIAPEPSRAMLLLGGLGMLALVRKRRRS